MKKEKPEPSLPVGTLKCPICEKPLHFKQIHGIRLVENGLLTAKCPDDNIYFNVKSNLK